MTPGTTTGPGENKENQLDRRIGETTNHGEQVRHTRNECTRLTKNDPSFQKLIEEYHQKGKTREQVKEEFKRRLRGLSKATRDKMGIESAGDDTTDTEIEAFLSKTGCFDNQLIASIDADQRARDKAGEALVDSCIEVAHDEYGNFDEAELRQSLKKEEMGRLQTFLKTPKYRKTYLNKLPGSRDLRDKNFSDVNFEEITKKISELPAAHPKRREIQEAWLKIAHVAHPDSNLASAFHNISHEGGSHIDIAGAYSAFFGKDNTLISAENREKILNFLVRQYTPIVPLSVLAGIDPASSKKYLTSGADEAEIEKNLPTDPELAEAVRTDRREQWEKTYKTHIGGGKNMIGTRSLPFETKVRILSQFGSIGKAENMRNYYRGKPGSLRSSTDTEGEFREKFIATYGIDTEKLDTKSGLTEELVARLGHRVDGIEHFDAGCAMQWKSKNKETGEEMTGYYIIDTVPGDTLDEDNILTVRFLGDDKDPLSPGGLAHHYTGADFYEYLSGCAEDGRITFRERGEFDTELEKNTTDKKLPRYFTDIETQLELRSQFPDTVEVVNFEQFNTEVDQLLNPGGNNPKEAKSPKERELHEGMIFCKTGTGGIDTFQVQGLDKEAGTITLWDGWGTGKKSVIEMSFSEFLRTLKSMKQGGNKFHRAPTGGKKITIDIFNTLCSNKDQYDDGLQKRMGKLTIREENGTNVFGQFDEKSGNFTAMPVVKIGDKKDLYIESIDGATVTYRVGSFTRAEYDKDKDKWTKKNEFRGSPSLTMNLEMLWAYLQNHRNFTLDKPLEKVEKKIDEKKGGSMSWWNIFMHSHSFGVLLHGDLWKAPFKAWEEQHHKDHAFHGKITAALAIEKLQGGKGPIGGILNWAEWPSLMVADGNGSLQSYLEELVNKIDGMGSYHRTRLIKRWSSKEHFPSPKFMAAMFASMQIFGQLYPYDGGENDYKNKDGSHEWFWYNSICHSLDPNHAKYPHMPPHDGKPWPEKWTKEGYKMNEIDACYEIFSKFDHPMLKNLGRRFQKYMNKGQEGLADGGKGNLNQRTTMTEKLDWMMGTAVGAKLPELFGASTELWLTEGYPTEITTMPYAAILFGHREEQMLPPTREHIKTQFQEGNHIPMFVFMQNKDLGDVFRKTGIAFAYTISSACGKELEELTHDAGHERLSGDRARKWSSKFQKFWGKHGKELMHKLSGMKDPTLNLMMNDSTTFEKVIEGQTGQKKEDYEKLYRDKGAIKAYYDRLTNTFDSPSHAEEKRGKGFYSGDHFRFREEFGVGYPIAWVNWDAYLDANLDANYAAGGGANTDGDGVFKEMREFFYQLPRMAEEMAKNMGFPGNKEKIDMIARSIYEANIAKIKACDGIKKIKADKPDVAYCSMTAMMLGMIDIKQLSKDASAENVARYADLKSKMQTALRKAKEKENTDFTGAIKYRADMAAKFRTIVEGEIDTRKVTLNDIEATADMHDLEDESPVRKAQEKTQARSGTVLREKLEKFDTMARDGSSEEKPTRESPERGES